MSSPSEISPIAQAVLERETARIAALGSEWRPTYENLCEVAEQVLAAETREHRKKQTEGIGKAQAAGKKCGRPAIQMPDNFDKIFRQLQACERTIPETAKELGVGRGTLEKWIGVMKKRECEQ